MSIFGRLVAGAAAAIQSQSNRYIDEDLATRRAQSLADIQRTSAVSTEADLDAQRNSPERVARDRQRRVGDVIAVAGAGAQGERQTAIDARGDTGYQEALDADQADKTRREADLLRALEGVRMDERVRGERLASPVLVDRAAGIADAQGRAQAKYREPQVDAVTTKVNAIEKILGRSMSEEERLTAVGLAKTPKPDDGVKVEQTTTDKDGNQTKRTFNEPKPKPPTVEQAHDEARAAIASGKPAAAVKSRLKALGYPDLPDGPLRPAPLMKRATETATRDPIDLMSMRDLRRIAGIDGHVNQAKARAELERRMAASDETEASMSSQGY